MTARKRRTCGASDPNGGTPCPNPAVLAGDCCRGHGGITSPAAREVADTMARLTLERLGHAVQADPLGQLQALASAWRKRQNHAWAAITTSAGPTAAETEQYQTAHDHVSDLLTTLVRIDVAGRRAAITARFAADLDGLFADVGVSPERAETLRNQVLRDFDLDDDAEGWS